MADRSILAAATVTKRPDNLAPRWIRRRAIFSKQKIAAHSKCEDRVLLERPVGGNAKKLVATVLREGLSEP
jgi:hypothetical protein